MNDLDPGTSKTISNVPESVWIGLHTQDAALRKGLRKTQGITAIERPKIPYHPRLYIQTRHPFWVESRMGELSLFPPDNLCVARLLQRLLQSADEAG